SPRSSNAAERWFARRRKAGPEPPVPPASHSFPCPPGSCTVHVHSGTPEPPARLEREETEPRRSPQIRSHLPVRSSQSHAAPLRRSQRTASAQQPLALSTCKCSLTWRHLSAPDQSGRRDTIEHLGRTFKQQQAEVQFCLCLRCNTVYCRTLQRAGK